MREKNPDADFPAWNDVPDSQCPKCKAWLPDYDGFGVLRHPECGYCSHASITDGVCQFCGKEMEDF